MVHNGGMRRRFTFVVAWVLVTGVSVLIATQAVGTVRDQVTDAPATLSPVASSVIVAATSSSSPSPVSTLVPSTTPAPATSSTTTVPDTLTTSTQPGTTAAPRTTTTPTTTPTTTTTEAPQAMEVATYQLTGGWVRIRYGGGDVVLVDAAPYAGFSMKIDEDGPNKVEVEFEGKDYEGEFKADMEDGPLDVDIDESNHDE